MAAHEGIEERRFADVGASNESELGKAIGGAIFGSDAAFDEIGFQDTSISGVVTQQYVGTVQDSGAVEGDTCLRRNKELLEGQLCRGWGYGCGF